MSEELQKIADTLYHAAVAITSASDFLREQLPIPAGEMKLIREAIKEAREALEKADRVLDEQEQQA